MFFNPLNLNYAADEQIIIVVRRHWFNILQNIIPTFCMAALLFGSYTFLPSIFSSLNKSAFNGLFLFGESLFAMVIWIIFFLILIDYYFDVWIVTNRRIINVEQKGLFSRTVSELEIDKVQDISTEVFGVIPTFLNYGDVQIQTAAEEEKFMFRRVPDPYHIKDTIMGLQKKHAQDATQELKEIIQNK